MPFSWGLSLLRDPTRVSWASCIGREVLYHYLHLGSPYSCSVQFSCSVVSDTLRPHGLKHTRLPCPSPTPRVYSVMSIESVMPPNHLILCCPLLLPPSIFPSIRVLSSESVLCIRWPKYYSFSISIIPSNEYSGLISFRIGWISLKSKGLSRVCSNTTVQKHQFFSAQLSV